MDLDLESLVINFLADNSFTRDERRLDPGVYPSDPQGHTLLVGENQRSLTVLDTYGVIEVGGLEIRDPDHLDQFADRVRMVAERLRARRAAGFPPAVGAAPAEAVG